LKSATPPPSATKEAKILRATIKRVRIRFTKHANEKFAVLRRHKFSVAKKQVIKTLQDPDKLDVSRPPLLIAQRMLTATHVLRVVYKKERGTMIVITFYPGRKSQYEKDQE